jgi:phospholipase C
MADISHVIVLMLENRSFDCMLGRLYPKSGDFDGLSGDEFNHWNGADYKVWQSDDPLTPQSASIPTPDPEELFEDMNEQIFGVRDPGSTATPNMSGFVANYMSKAGRDPRAVMHGFTPKQVPVLSTLATSFGVSDRWHASAPNQTWPNRFFAHTATAGGYVNNEPLKLHTMDTIFNRLTQKQCSWRIYHHDVPQTLALTKLWSELPDHLYSFDDDFMTHAKTGKLPNYSFIEPRYFSSIGQNRMPNDQHPPHDIGYGERLIARCYDAIRNGPGWKNTLVIITYDEHGGTYDHVPPPAAASPDDFRPDGFAFDRYGVRVPAVLVSPWIKPGSIVRPQSGPYPFDHTSIIKTLSKLFDLGSPLTHRDADAPDLVDCLSLASPDNDGPRDLSLPTIGPPPAEIAEAQKEPPNNMQNSLATLAMRLPHGTAKIATHSESLRAAAAAAPAARRFRTVGEASAQAHAGLARFLNPGSQPTAFQAFAERATENSSAAP